ncbi:hypothetical protein, partial [Rhodococcus sp. YH1]
TTRDARKVYAKCVSIAMSAHRRGWTEAQYVDAIANVNSRLWAQLMTRRDGRTASMPTAYRQLRKAWETGVANANNVGMRTREEIADDAVELAYAWADRLDARTDNLSADEIAVMTYVISETERRGMLRVACPGRDVAESARMPHRRAARVLGKLTERGMLVKYSAGKRGEPGKGRAAIYGLPPVEVVAHINGGSTPMCQPEERSERQDTLAAKTADAAPPAQDPEVGTVAHRDTSEADTESVAHRDTSALQWLRAFDDALRAEGYDPEALDTPEWGVFLAGFHAAGHDAGTVAAKLAAKWRSAA